ncbi:MAG: sugar ABC transporter permease [Chloroflexi bacterium]|nr:sugar ABC transporter permease [Chloroflexota bacterium]
MAPSAASTSSGPCSTCRWSRHSFPSPLFGSGCTSPSSGWPTNSSKPSTCRPRSGCAGPKPPFWKNMGLNMVIYLAGLQGIPPHLYEAAEIDGAGRISKLFRITIPLLAPTTYFVVIVYFIGALQMFVQVFIMACQDATAGCGGPVDSTVTIVLLIYEEAFTNLRMGFAAALSFLLFVVIGIITLINSKLLEYEISY